MKLEQIHAVSDRSEQSQYSADHVLHTGIRMSPCLVHPLACRLCATKWSQTARIIAPVCAHPCNLIHQWLQSLAVQIHAHLHLLAILEDAFLDRTLVYVVANVH